MSDDGLMIAFETNKRGRQRVECNLKLERLGKKRGGEAGLAYGNVCVKSSLKGREGGDEPATCT